MKNKVKRLYRSKKDKVVAGVCGGLGEYFDLDPVIFRILFVILTLTSGMGVLMYLILVLVVPYAGEEASASINEDVNRLTKNIKTNKRWFDESNNLIAMIIIGVGVVALVQQLFPMVWLNVKTLGPIMMIVVGCLIIFKNERRK